LEKVQRLLLVVGQDLLAQVLTPRRTAFRIVILKSEQRADEVARSAVIAGTPEVVPRVDVQINHVCAGRRQELRLGRVRLRQVLFASYVPGVAVREGPKPVVPAGVHVGRREGAQLARQQKRSASRAVVRHRVALVVAPPAAFPSDSVRVLAVEKLR